MYNHETKLVFDRVCCQRGGRVLFSDLSFTLKAGSMLAIYGANGVGKSSLLRVAAQFLPPQSGRVQGVLPHQIHYIGHQSGLKDHLSVLDNLSFWQNWLARPMPGTQRETQEGKRLTAKEALRIMGLGDVADYPAAILSAGQKQRLALARLLIAPRPLWLLDEPMASLDDEARAWLFDLMDAHIAQNGAILLASHEKIHEKINITHESLTLRFTHIHYSEAV